MRRTYRRSKYVPGAIAGTMMRRRKIAIRSTFVRGAINKYGNFKLRGVLQLTSDGAGSINAGVRLTQPDSIDGAGTALTDWTSVLNLYDEFRVTSIKVQYIPQLPNDPSGTSAFNPAYVFTDFDSTGLVSTVAGAVGYDNMKVKNLYRPWSYFMRVPRMTAANSATIARVGWMDTNSPAVTGSIYIRADNLDASTQYGKIILTYYIVAHNRK